MQQNSITATSSHEVKLANMNVIDMTATLDVVHQENPQLVHEARRYLGIRAKCPYCKLRTGLE